MDNLADKLMGIYTKKKINSKKHRPINLIVYILILLSKGHKNPLLLDVLCSCCLYKGENYGQNQEHLFAIFSENSALLKFMLSDLKIVKNRGESKLMSFTDEGSLNIEDCFNKGEILDLREQENRDNYSNSEASEKGGNKSDTPAKSKMMGIAEITRQKI